MFGLRRWLFKGLGLTTIAGVLIIWCSLGGCCAVDRTAVPLSPPVVPETDTDEMTTSKVTPLPAVDLTSRALPRIPAGTVIGKKSPAGWSALLLIATPTLTKEDLRDAPRIATHYAQMFKFTLLARTEKVKEQYQLQSVARGFAVDIDGKNVIVESGKTGRARLGAFGPRILSENEKVLDEDVRQVARTPTMLVFDAQAVMRQGQDHVRMVNRHAILANPETGKVTILVWLLAKSDVGYALAEKHLQLLPEAMHEDRLLSVKRNRFVLGMPTAEAFALMRIPQGTSITPTKELTDLVGLKTFTNEQVIRLEEGLRAVTSRK